MAKRQKVISRPWLDRGPYTSEPMPAGAIVWPHRRPAYCPRPKRKRQEKRPAFRKSNPTMGTLRRWELRVLRQMGRR